MAFMPYDDKIQNDLDTARLLIPKKNATNAGAAKAVKKGGLVDTVKQHNNIYRDSFINNGLSNSGVTKPRGTTKQQTPVGKAITLNDILPNDVLPLASSERPGLSGRNMSQRILQPEVKPTTSQVTAAGQSPAVSAETTANAALNPSAAVQESPRTIVQSDAAGKVTGLDTFPPPSPDIAPITAIRGTQQETINPAGVPQGGAPGLAGAGIGRQSGDGTVVENTEFDAYTPGNYDMNTARAVSLADSIRRNVFSTPGESDAMAIEKTRGANQAASDVLKANTQGATDKEKLAAEKALGLDTLAVRRAEIAGREKVANINAKGGVTDYKKGLEQAVAMDQFQYYNRLKEMQEDTNEETKQRNLEIMQEARPEWYKEYMGQEY